MNYSMLSHVNQLGALGGNFPSTPARRIDYLSSDTDGKREEVSMRAGRFGSPGFLVLLVLFGAVCAPRERTDAVRSLSYRGHEDEEDTARLAAVYPAIVGTRLDDCQTCHRTGEVVLRGGERRTFDHCAYCHLMLPDSEFEVVAQGPERGRDTLNPFGVAYLEAGRTIAAFAAIEGADADGDGFANGRELAELRYPGDAGSRPGQQTIPTLTYTRDDLQALPTHEQFLLLNSHRQLTDTYGLYAGVRVKDLLAATGADLSAATSVTFICPDGFDLEFDLAEVERPFPGGLYFAGLDFVTYPPEDQRPDGLRDGAEVPGEPWMILAHHRDGRPIDPGLMDPATGRLQGEGPYRLIVPQRRPGVPDRGSKHSPSGRNDGYDYDDDKDHNAGRCARSVVAMRINPMPAGYEEFDWKHGGYGLVERGELIVYGAGLPRE